MLVLHHKDYSEFPYRYWPFATRAGVDIENTQMGALRAAELPFCCPCFLLVLFGACGRAGTALYRPSLTAGFTEPHLCVSAYR
mgnify:CR=1 FL=1